jgi:hypothetical protein
MQSEVVMPHLSQPRDIKISPGASFQSAPKFALLPVTLQSRLTAKRPILNYGADGLDNALQSIRSIDVNLLTSRLMHRLSDAFVRKQFSEGRDIVSAATEQLTDVSRALAERAACAAAVSGLKHFWGSRDSQDLCDLLIEACSTASNKRAQFRTASVKLGSDTAGNFWVFPPPIAVKSLVVQLGQDVGVAYQQSPLYAAIIALVGINAIHPFMDGNGRTSRVVFNAVLRTGLVIPDRAYIPLKHIYFIAKFGFELRLREAILLGDYGPVITFFCDVMDLIEELCIEGNGSKESSLPERWAGR